MKSAEEIINQLATGKTVESVPDSLTFLLRPVIQPYLISWFRFNPSEEISRLSVPVMIVQGTTDIQVSVEDARLLVRANPKAKLLIVEGMNHVLKAVPPDMAKQVASYSDPALPVVTELISGVSRFLNESAGRISSRVNGSVLELCCGVHLISTSLQRGDKILTRNARSRFNGFSGKPLKRLSDPFISLVTPR